MFYAAVFLAASRLVRGEVLHFHDVTAGRGIVVDWREVRSGREVIVGADAYDMAVCLVELLGPSLVMECFRRRGIESGSVKSLDGPFCHVVPPWHEDPTTR